MITVVDIIRDCLNKGITSEYDILLKLKEVFSEADSYKLRGRIKSTITYLNRKNLPKSEFEIQGAPIIIGHHDKLINTLRLVREKTDLKICKFIWGRGRRCYYRRPYTFTPGDFIRISSNSWSIRDNNDDYFLGVILHELVHANGFYGHDEKFYNKLTNVGIQCGLNLSNWFAKEYPTGKRFYTKNVRPKIDSSVLTEWEKK